MTAVAEVPAHISLPVRSIFWVLLFPSWISSHVEQRPANVTGLLTFFYVHSLASAIEHFVPYAPSLPSGALRTATRKQPNKTPAADVSSVRVGKRPASRTICPVTRSVSLLTIVELTADPSSLGLSIYRTYPSHLLKRWPAGRGLCPHHLGLDDLSKPFRKIDVFNDEQQSPGRPC
ncbi:hypothetical protein ZHAS_00021018 [Anopheles sinensis]|uniref:Uncharacterized protein n=1 Tax=Anopheles sinensis TaxID=74873 RepID=A0A084WR81_ANOSI|nr:hypothetical protein ZHAS_00021018 [Anopheles sinensis]